GVDLRRYNVLILPPGGLNGVLSRWGDDLATWVRGGGTLIACESAAVAVTSMEPALTSVTLRRNALDDLEAFAVAAQREADGRNVGLDLADLWGDEAPAAAAGHSEDSDGEAVTASAVASAVDPATVDVENVDVENVDPASVDPDAERQDQWERRFSPAGVILRGAVDDRSWITAGCGSELPVLVAGSHALLAREPASTAVRLAGEETLRLSGLLWPEARHRLADSAWLTVEHAGAGQVILFSGVPGFRGQFVSAARLFGNAVVLGPGLGASPPGEW
ncbi:MAG: hypothetical protein ACI9EF_003565, partial [Pseudohongiellaceae bacterium]